MVEPSVYWPGSSLYDLLVTSIVHLLTRTSSDGGRWCTLSDVKIADALKFHKGLASWQVCGRNLKKMYTTDNNLQTEPHNNPFFGPVPSFAEK